MSRFYPHTEYPEDQPFSRTILTVHVLSRGYLVGSMIGFGVGTTAHLAALYKSRHASSSDSPISPLSRPLSLRLLRSAGLGAFIGLAVLSVGLPAQMYAKEDIEWKDRSWRLLENKGQVETDDWIGVGALAGLGGVLSPAVAKKYGGLHVLGWRGVIGGAALGTLGGAAGQLLYRQWYKGGKWEDD